MKVLALRFTRPLIVLAVLVLSMASAPAGAWAADKMTLRLDWIPGSEHAFMYLGKEKGWFTAEGIDLDVIAGQGSTLSVKLVGNGDNDFAFSDGATLVQAWESGVPLVSLAVLYRDTPTVVVAKREKKIAKLEDLCGRKMGVMVKSTTYAQFKGMLSAANVSCKFEEVPASPGGRELMAGAVDAQHHYTFLLPVLMRQGNLDVVEIPARKYFKLYSQTLITNRTTLTQRRELVAGFMRAAMRSLRHAIDHPEEALAAFLKAHREAKPEYEREKLKIVNEFFTMTEPGGKGLGWQTADGWSETAKTLARLSITKATVDTTGKFTNEFVQ